MQERLERLAAALAQAGYDGYVSGARPDVAYFTGSADTAGIFIFESGRTPILLMRAGGVAHARDTAAAEVVSFGPDEDADAQLVRLVGRLQARRLATAGLSESQLAVVRRAAGREAEPAPGISSALRRSKEPREIDLLRQAAAIADAAMAAAMAVIRVGASELEAAAALEAEARRRGCEGAIAPAQVKAGLRSAYPDAVASPRRFEPGDLGFIDLGIFFQGYLGDMTRAFVIGDLSPERQRILDTVDRVQRLAREMVRPGAHCREIDAAVRREFAAAGYPGNPPHHTGHAMGLGDDIPRLVPQSDDVIEVGDMVTVEPGIYVPGVGGVRLEDVVLVGEHETEILSRHPRITHIPT